MQRFSWPSITVHSLNCVIVDIIRLAEILEIGAIKKVDEAVGDSASFGFCRNLHLGIPLCDYC